MSEAKDKARLALIEDLAQHSEKPSVRVVARWLEDRIKTPQSRTDTDRVLIILASDYLNRKGMT